VIQLSGFDHQTVAYASIRTMMRHVTEMAALLAGFVAPGAATEAQQRYCTDDLGCSLNGACRNGTCTCDSGWLGLHCERLDLLPADLRHGYNHLSGHENDNGSTSSWGATQLRGDDGLYHTFVGEMYSTHTATAHHPV
jgi:hypothetical protein